jgi:phosphoglycolate phosphatase
VSTGIECANVLLARRGLRQLGSVEEYRKIFCFPITEYYRRLGLDLEAERFDDIAHEWMEQYLIFSRESKLCGGAVQLLDYIKSRGVSQAVLSATERGMLICQLEQYGISGYFDEIVGRGDIRASSKEGVARQWFRRAKPRSALMIGDTLHDAQVAAAIGARCVLSASGHQSRELLETAGVTVCSGLGQIRELMEEGQIEIV